VLLVFDEVQTGFFGSGKPWLWQIHGVLPDVVAFGKKTQVCGIYASGRVDEVEATCSARRAGSTRRGAGTSRTWSAAGSSSRSSRRAPRGERRRPGERFVEGLRALAKERGGITNVRGVGSLAAFTLESPEARKRMLDDLRAKRLLALASGERASASGFRSSRRRSRSTPRSSGSPTACQRGSDRPEPARPSAIPSSHAVAFELGRPRS
jgi:L-lysine 6-transaminase